MKTRIISLLACAVFLAACGSTVPPPVERSDPSAELAKRADAAAAATRAAVDGAMATLHGQLDDVAHQAQLAAQQAEVAVEAVREQGRRVPTIVAGKAPVAVPPVFSRADPDPPPAPP